MHMFRVSRGNTPERGNWHKDELRVQVNFQLLKLTRGF